MSFFNACALRLQDMEIQYRKEKEEADLLLEQHRLVRFTALSCDSVSERVRFF